MNVCNISDQLPTYPNNIQGELRLILQTKDIFLVCYKHLEEYRRLVNEQNRLITKEFVQEQLQIGEDEISELRMELQDAESRLGARLRHNELLADHLASLGYASLESGASVRHLALCRSPQMRKNMLAQRQSAGGLGGGSDGRPPTHMIDNIALAISEIHQEVRTKVKPLLDYYRDLFYLQLHFSLVLGQVCNYCMPLVTENIGLIDRIFFWSERPEFDLIRRAGDIGDRLREIYTRAQTVLGVLSESVRFLQSKVELQKSLEQRFHERLDEQQKTKDKILREVHTTKQNMDMLEEENDRLVGSLVKVDPSFVDSRHFYELAEGGNMNAPKRQASKPTDNNNENAQETMNNINTSVPRQDTFEDIDAENRNNSELIVPNRNRRSMDLVSPSGFNIDDANNNKALSIAADPPTEGLVVKETSKNQKDQEELSNLLKDIRAKMFPESNKTVPSQNQSSKSGETSILSNSLIENPSTENIQDDTTTISSRKPKTPTTGTMRSRSKSQRRDGPHERRKRSPIKEPRKHSSRRDRSIERQEKTDKSRKHRSKSSAGKRRTKTEKSMALEETEISHELIETTPIIDSKTEVLSNGSSLKSRILGRTKDLLEAALKRSPKDSHSDQPSQTGDGVNSSLTTGRIEHDENGNDGVTSVSSFASLLIAESPLGEPDMMINNPVEINRPTQKKNRRTLESRNTRKSHSTKRGKTVSPDDQLGPNPLPMLSSDVLLVENSNEPGASSGFLNQVPDNRLTPKRKSSKTRRMSSQKSNSLGDYLTGSGGEELTPLAAANSALPSLL